MTNLIEPAGKRGRTPLYQDATVEDLKTRGVEFTKEITDERWGRTTTLKLPGDGQVALYEPRHPSPLYPTS